MNTSTAWTTLVSPGDLARRLDVAGVEYEAIVIPDDTHHWMLHRNALLVGKATAEFLERKLGGRPGGAAGPGPE